MRKKIAAGNWKMFKTFDEAVALAKDLSKTNIPEDVLCIIAPPYPYLSKLSGISNDSPRMHVSAQNCHEEASGAYTGEVSAPMLKSLRIPYVIIGHSERREQHLESNATLKAKVLAALENGLKPIFCCGEALDIRKSNEHIVYVTKQITESLEGLSKEQMSNITVAYEPIWAIGTGETASPQQAQEMHEAIRNHLLVLFDEETAENTSILYGGSVKPGNAKELFANKDVDGGLVGGAALDVESFSAILNSF